MLAFHGMYLASSDSGVFCRASANGMETISWSAKIRQRSENDSFIFYLGQGDTAALTDLRKATKVMAVGIKV